MQHIQILAVGTLKEAGFAAACAEYQKRLGAFCRLEVVELPEAKLAKNPSDAQIQQCIEAEGQRMLQKLPPKAYAIALCIEGRTISSQALADTVGELQTTHSQVSFLIGGSHGLSDAVKARAQKKLSMSPMTFPHQLARVMLLEQVYRAFAILSGSKYHK